MSDICLTNRTSAAALLTCPSAGVAFDGKRFVYVLAGRGIYGGMHYLMPKQKYVAGAMAMTCARMHVRRTREMVILGTQYAGEMKKGIFSVMHYLMPKRGILSLHSGCNVGANDDVSLFFGLSGVFSWICSASLCAQPSSSPLWQQLGAPHCTMESRQLAGVITRLSAASSYVDPRLVAC